MLASTAHAYRCNVTHEHNSKNLRLLRLRPGLRPGLRRRPRATFGKILAENRIGLVYGGGSVGLMGELASAVLDHGGEVTGIIPEFLDQPRARHATRGELIVTRDMHERKQRMFEHADAFVALPGGVGTLEELVEQMTWAQLGRHKKPILLANIKGFWDPLCALLDHMEELAVHPPRPVGRTIWWPTGSRTSCRS